VNLKRFGGFDRAAAIEAAWRRLRLTVQVATKPNRNLCICTAVPLPDLPSSTATRGGCSNTASGLCEALPDSGGLTLSSTSDAATASPLICLGLEVQG